MMADLPEPTIAGMPGADYDVLNVLAGYKNEAFDARQSGENPRDEKWRENLDLFWGRYDFSQKAKWQAKVVPPDVPQFVGRFAAALTEALMVPERFFTVSNEHDREDVLTSSVAKMMDVWLGQCGRSPDGSVLGFDAVFEETMAMGALTNAAVAIVPRIDNMTGDQYVAAETVDPRRLWLDHTRRGLYRIHRQEMDLHRLMAEARRKDAKGGALYNLEEVEKLVSTLLGTMDDDTRRLTGGGTGIASARKPIVLDEYLCTLLTPGGKEIMRNALCVVANESVLIRGPEPNPFWHKRDWVISTPLIPVPLSVYGRSYMEDFGSLARLYAELTNMIVDAVYTSSLKVFTRVPDMLADPSQLEGGVFPNATFDLDTGLGRPEDFLRTVDMGVLSPDAVRVWQLVKDRLEAAAMQSELMQGQFAPKGRTSAQEIQEVSQNSSAMIRSVARTAERKLLEPALDRIWRTGLQLMKRDDAALRAAVGDQMFEAVWARRREFASAPFKFRVRAISGLIAKSNKLRMLLQSIAVISRSPQLMQAFATKYSPEKLLDILLELHNIDAVDLKLSDQERLMQQLTQAAQRPQGVPTMPQGATGAAPGRPAMPAGV